MTNNNVGHPMITDRTCIHCGKPFRAKSTEVGKYCSKDCYRAYEAVHGRVSNVVERLNFSCKQCGKPFHRTEAQLRAYRKIFDKDPLYCSRECSAIGRRLPEDKWQVTCIQCGQPMPIQRRPGGTINRQKRLCSTACRSKFRQERASGYQSGVLHGHKKRNGYIWLSIPAYASKTGKKTEMLEHRYVMEKRLGRELLPEETVHHVDGDRGNNADSNLELFSSRHGPGQRVVDKIAFAIEMLLAYPEFASEAGYRLVKVAEDHVATQPAQTYP